MDKRSSLKFIENIVEPYPLHKRTPLSESHPEVAAYWHFEKNRGFGPEEFSAGSQVKAWWQCVVDETHVFQQTIKKRIASEQDGCPGHGCTFCRGLLPAANNWLANYPNLVSEWLTEKNGRAPEQIVAKSKFMAWWRCSLCASEWQTQVLNRTIKGSGCHYCAGYKVSEVNSLASLRPDLVTEWLVRKNGNLTPDDVTTGSPREVWWQCKNDPSHIWTASIADRAVKNHGCWRCQRKTRRKLTDSQLSKAKRLISDGQLAYKVAAKFDVSRETLSHRLKSGYFENPDFAAEWHPTLNGELSPDSVGVSSRYVAWWRCRYDSTHVFQQSVFDRAKRKCPLCNDKNIEEKSLARSSPKLAVEWHTVKNGDLTPETVTFGSNKKVWWICEQKHEWQAQVTARFNLGSGCPFCAKKFLLKENSLVVRFPEIAAQWHKTKNRKMLPSLQGSFVANTNKHLAPEDRPTKNRRLTPEDVSYGSKQMVWWQCPINAEHVWQAMVKDRTNGKGCPYCANRMITKDNNLAACNPAVASQWHPTRNKPLLPSEVTPGSQKIVWWRCPRSGKHVWQARVGRIVGRWNSGTNGCPFCSGKKVTDESCLLAKHPDVAKLWHPTLNEELTPSLVTPYSVRKIWWQCPKGTDHVWSAPVASVVLSNQKGRSGCPFCASQKVSHESSLEAKYPDLAKQWHRELNESLQPDQVMPASNKVAWWRCPIESNHAWQKKINLQLEIWKKGRSFCPECKAK